MVVWMPKSPPLERATAGVEVVVVGQGVVVSRQKNLNIPGVDVFSFVVARED